MGVNSTTQAAQCAVVGTSSGCEGAVDMVGLAMDWWFARHVDFHAGVAWSQKQGGLANNFVLTSIDGVHANQLNTVCDPALVCVTSPDVCVRTTSLAGTSKIHVFRAVLGAPVPHNLIGPDRKSSRPDRSRGIGGLSLTIIEAQSIAAIRIQENLRLRN